MKFALALFGAPRDIRLKLADKLQRAFSKPSCSIHDLESSIVSAARALFGLPSDILAHHPDQWRDPEGLYYGKTIEKILKATYKFATHLDEGVLVDRVLDEIRSMPPTCPYCIVRDGRTLKEWNLFQAKRNSEVVLIGVLVKKSKVSPFSEDDFDVAVEIRDADQDMDDIVKTIVDWTYEVHGAASSS